MMLFLAVFTADVLKVADRAVDIAVIRLAAMVAASDDDILVGSVDRYGNPLVEDIAFTVEQMALYFGIFAVGDDSAFQLSHVIKAFMQQEAGQFLTADSSCTIGQNFFILKLAQILADPFRELAEGFHL